MQAPFGLLSEFARTPTVPACVTRPAWGAVSQTRFGPPQASGAHLFASWAAAGQPRFLTVPRTRPRPRVLLPSTAPRAPPVRKFGGRLPFRGPRLGQTPCHVGPGLAWNLSFFIIEWREEGQVGLSRSRLGDPVHFGKQREDLETHVWVGTQ